MVFVYYLLYEVGYFHINAFRCLQFSGTPLPQKPVPHREFIELPMSHQTFQVHKAYIPSSQRYMLISGSITAPRFRNGDIFSAFRCPELFKKIMETDTKDHTVYIRMYQSSFTNLHWVYCSRRHSLTWYEHGRERIGMMDVPIGQKRPRATGADIFQPEWMDTLNAFSVGNKN